MHKMQKPKQTQTNKIKQSNLRIWFWIREFNKCDDESRRSANSPWMDVILHENEECENKNRW